MYVCVLNNIKAFIYTKMCGIVLDKITLFTYFIQKTTQLYGFCSYKNVPLSGCLSHNYFNFDEFL